MRAPLASTILILLLLAPLVAAHVQDTRPRLQDVERDRMVDVEMEDQAARVELHLSTEPLRHYIRHDLEPTRGRFSVEYRDDASDAANAFRTTFHVERLLEYGDRNRDGAYQEDTDTPIKAWRLQFYRWQTQHFPAVQVSDVQAESILWEGNLSGAPDLRIEAAVAGKGFTDEGALVRAQDVILYVDVLNLPRRSLGSLYVLEGRVTTNADAAVSLTGAQNVSTGLIADVPDRRALLMWGGEAVLDGVETRLNATLGEGVVDPEVDEGNASWPFRIHVPLTDESMRFVMVSGVEYVVPDRRATPGSAPAGLAVAVAAAAAMYLLVDTRWKR